MACPQTNLDSASFVNMKGGLACSQTNLESALFVNMSGGLTCSQTNLKSALFVNMTGGHRPAKLYLDNMCIIPAHDKICLRQCRKRGEQPEPEKCTTGIWTGFAGCLLWHAVVKDA